MSFQFAISSAAFRHGISIPVYTKPIALKQDFPR